MNGGKKEERRRVQGQAFQEQQFFLSPLDLTPSSPLDSRGMAHGSPKGGKDGEIPKVEIEKNCSLKELHLHPGHLPLGGP